MATKRRPAERRNAGNGTPVAPLPEPVVEVREHSSARRVLVAVAVAIGVIAAVVAVLAVRHGDAPVASILKSAPRDVVLITIDTLRADALGYTGNTRVQTPFLDSLAAKGIVFTNAHAHNVITLPSHVNILTGLYPFQHGVRENAGFTLSPKIPTVATMLKPLGYATGAFIGAFPLDARFGLNQGFDTYDDNYGKGQATIDFVMQERRADAVLSAATTWWRAHRGQKRFMWVHLFDAHAPYEPPEPFLSRYRGDEYHGEIAWMDSQLQAQLGPVLAEDRDALVIVTGDHGEALGDHGELTHGLFAYESTLKIPLIVEGAGLGHRTESAYVRHIDIVPTILAAVGGRAPSDLRGAPLTGTIGPRDSYFESLSASLNRGWAPLAGIIHSGEKYIDLPIAELYDLRNDPKEKNNLRDERRRDVEAARKLLAPSMVAPGARSVDAATVANLRSLGYVSGSGAKKKTYTAADDPKNLVGLDSKMHRAIDAFERHQPARALELAREVVAERPDMTAGREILAFMLQQNDRISEAIDQLTIVLNDPNANDDDRVQLALLYCEIGRAEDAVHLLQIRANDRDPDLLNAYGVALLDAGRHADASRQFQHILSIDPNNAPALQNLGIAALRKSDRAAARTYLTRALALNPRLPDALNTLGVVYAEERQYAEAVNAWKAAVSVDPRQYDALFNTGLVEGSLGHRDSAREALTRFVNTAPRERYASDIAKAKKGLAELQ